MSGPLYFFVVVVDLKENDRNLISSYIGRTWKGKKIGIWFDL